MTDNRYYVNSAVWLEGLSAAEPRSLKSGYNLLVTSNNTPPPARTSILVAAARAFGSRDPEPTLRNPDYLAERLIGTEELALISEHQLAQAMMGGNYDASDDPAVMGFPFLMLMRTRFIDGALERAVKNGATQVVILGAGFDSRAHRFRELLKDCRVVEVDAAPTQEYKKRRVASGLGDQASQNVSYCAVNFAKDDLGDALRGAGVRETEKTFYIWEGVTFYLTEESVRKTLGTVAARSAAGSSLVLDYLTALALEMVGLQPPGSRAIPASWGEPWLFGVPDGNGSEYFRTLGFDPGAPWSTTNADAIKLYAGGRDGLVYGEGFRAKMQANAKALFEKKDGEPGAADALPANQITEVVKAIMKAGGFHWMTELTLLG